MKICHYSLHWLFAFLFLGFPHSIRAKAGQTARVDLSYRHNLESKVLLDALVDNLGILNEDRPETRQSVLVDLTSSAGGDELLQGLCESLLENHDGEAPTVPAEVHLTARMNGLSPLGVARFLQSAIKKTTNTTQASRRRSFASIDLGWNDLSVDGQGGKTLAKAVRDLVQSETDCPDSLRLSSCGIGPEICRAIGKGLMDKYAVAAKNRSTALQPLVLHLSCNPLVGDGGTAAIAAATRAVGGTNNGTTVFDTLDLSACDVGDVGAEALALALESAVGCCIIRHLDLSNNKMTDKGACALARALVESSTQAIESLDLSNNEDLSDKGAAALALAIEKGKLQKLLLRSCSVHADGAEAFGRALRKQVEGGAKETLAFLSLDLSGNPLGMLRKKKKKGSKYEQMRDKASSTASSYMNQGLSFLKKGLKDVGVDVSPMLPTSESDDDEEAAFLGQKQKDEDDPARARCGLKALANAFGSKVDATGRQSAPRGLKHLELSLRRCFLDHAAAEALAHLRVEAMRLSPDLNLELDVQLNPVLEEDMVEALHGQDESQLHEMAEVFSDRMEAIEEAEQRAKEASRIAAARFQDNDDGYDDDDDDTAWDPSPPDDVGDEEDDVDEEEEDEWDSDADYEKEDESDW